MKNLLYFLLLASSTLFAQEMKLLEVLEGTNTYTWGEPTRKGAVVKIWLHYKFNPVVNKVSYMRVYSEVDCIEKYFLDKGLVYYDMDGKPLPSEKLGLVPRYVVPGSIGEDLLDKICMTYK